METQKCYNTCGHTIFGLGLSGPKAIVCHTKNQLNLWKKTSKSAKHRLPLRYKKSVKIAMHFDLDNIIKLQLTTNFDRCAILNVLNCLTKDFKPC